MQDRALVLGGGGVAGIGWMTGLLLGLEQSGVALRSAGRIIGTSAGAAMAAQLAGPLDLPALFERQIDPAKQVHELTPHPDLLQLLWRAAPVLFALSDPAERTRRIGQMALEVATVPEAERRAVIAARLPGHDWPETALTLVAIDVESGDPALFNRSSGVPLVDAVAASCAVPGIWPPVTIGGRRYMDGGIRSSDNADLAAGSARIVVISPLGTQAALTIGTGLAAQVGQLEGAGAAVRLVEPDDAARAAIGANPLAPETRGPAAEAGLVQGQRLAATLAGFWN